jgi:hypothetical protein
MTLQRAGDGIRTHDVQLGKPQAVTSNSQSNQDLTSSHSAGCTSGCTGEAETVNVEALAAALANLSAEDRARLVALLLAGQAGGKAASDPTAGLASGNAAAGR